MAGYSYACPDRPANAPAVFCEEGNVILRLDEVVYVADAPHLLEVGAKIVAKTPHEGGDYSYLCNHPHCRCSD